jgi:hypothetical protein
MGELELINVKNFHEPKDTQESKKTTHRMGETLQMIY